MPSKTKSGPTKSTKPSGKTREGSSAGRESRVLTAERIAGPEAGSSQADPAVIAFLRELDHPLKQEIEAVRQTILGASSEIREGIKWNSPSFRTTEYFATMNLRARDRVRLILHTGAKVKASSTKGVPIADPASLLEWLGKDRCLVTLGDGKDIQAKRAALQAVVREWIRQI